MSEARTITPVRPAPSRQSVTLDLPALITTAVDRGLDPATLQSLLTMYNDQQDRQNREAFNHQMADAAGEIEPVVMDASNKHLGNRYATHGAYMEVLRPILKPRGIRIAFELGAVAGEQPVPEGHVRVRMVVGYGSYAERGSYLDEPVSRGGARGGTTQMTEQQAVGSALTYAARNLLRMMFNLTPALDEDDDGEGSRTINTKTSNVKADTSIDHEQFKAAFRRRLHLAENEAMIGELLAHPEIAAWLANAPGPVKVDTDVMLAAKRKILAEAKPKQEEAKQEQEVGTNTQAPSELLTRVLARIASCETTTALDSCAIAPEFTTDLAKLNLLEGEVADEAIKARHRVLAGTKA